MTYPHAIALVFKLWQAPVAFLLLVLLAAVLVARLRRRSLAELFPTPAWLLRSARSSSRAFFTWLRRLPPRFSAPALVLLLFFFAVYPYAAYSLFTLPILPLVLGEGPAQQAAWVVAATILRLFFVTATSAVAVFLAAMWLNLSFLIAGLVYARLRHRVPPWLREWLDSPAASTPEAGAGAGEPDPDATEELARFERIGIILAGGGAKGAYQAGALRAVHQFLRRHGALGRVKMIAGTSIGSWNALFWLAGLIGAEGKEDLLELWWRNIKLDGLIEPAKYALGVNHFLSSRPWQDQFDAMFVTGPLRGRLEGLVGGRGEGGDISFYFTRTNVGKARLEFTTNRADLEAGTADVLGRRSEGAGGRRWTVASSVEDLRFAVFSSMTLPPLFQYMTLAVDGDPADTQYYEDGGVIDNLPVVFGTEVEDCDLLFVLPLNASFEEPVKERWMWKRVARVVNIRQGVLEQKSLADLKRLNESRRAAGGRPVSVFAVCPESDALISTGHFWNRQGAAAAFELMYKATRRALRERFVSTVRSGVLSVLHVDAEGEAHPHEV
jgi:predicted acylesterase/phospholipase RssA